MRCKVICESKDYRAEGAIITFKPVHGNSTENDSFFKYTPYGEIKLGLTQFSTADKYEPGKEYYVDFSPAI